MTRNVSEKGRIAKNNNKIYRFLLTNAIQNGIIDSTSLKIKIFVVIEEMVRSIMSDTRKKLIDNMTENLPVLRKKLKLSQDGLAKIIGTSRYTIMLVETRKRKMTWNTFLSLVLLFDKNKNTSMLLRVLEIYTDELDAYFKREPGVEI